MAESCTLKSTKYYTGLQITEYVNERYGTTYGNIVSAITYTGIPNIVSLATSFVSNPLGFIISFSISVGFSLASIKDDVDASILKSEVKTVLNKIKTNGGKMRVRVYSCIYTTGNGNASSGRYPKIKVDWVQ